MSKKLLLLVFSTLLRNPHIELHLTWGAHSVLHQSRLDWSIWLTLLLNQWTPFIGYPYTQRKRCVGGVHRSILFMMVILIEESDFCKALVWFISHAYLRNCAGWYSLKVLIFSDIPLRPEALGLLYMRSMMYMLQCRGLAGRRKDGSDWWIFFPQKFCTFCNTHYLEMATTDVISSKIAVSDEADNHGNGKKIRKKVYFIRSVLTLWKSSHFLVFLPKLLTSMGLSCNCSKFHDTMVFIQCGF